MKVFQAVLTASAIIGTNAMNFRGIFHKEEATASSSIVEQPAAVVEEQPSATTQDRSLTAEEEAEGERKLWCDPKSSRGWHPVYNAGWTNGFCRYTVDCNSPTYSSELACCKGAYSGQTSGYCLSRLPNPPTSSPTGSGGLDVYYPDYSRQWSDAYCINSRPMPSGRPTYTSMLACCKGAYAGQMSGKCLSMLPSPPTTSPTPAGGITDFWYPDYDTAWTEAGCLNTFPLPYKNKNDRPNYKTQLECCKGAYGGQMSGKCISQLPSPPTTSPTGSGGYDFYYPDYDTPWSSATCKNERPLPFGPGGRPTYNSMLACCKGAYAGQVSGACLAALPSPPTSSPTTAGGLDVYYPDYGTGWARATCINERPLPNGRPNYRSKEACCSGAYAGQSSLACMCDALGANASPPSTAAICYSCECGFSKAERDGAGCNLWCKGDPEP